MLAAKDHIEFSLVTRVCERSCRLYRIVKHNIGHEDTWVLRLAAQGHIRDSTFPFAYLLR
jgi:hypothetical protein